MTNNTNTQIKTRNSRELGYFFEKITGDLKKQFLNEVEVQVLGDLRLNKYDINQFNDKLQSLIVIGRLDDLNNKAIIGLIAHLYGLIYIGYDKNSVPKGKEWLRIDLYSDEVAKRWGFREEVEELRKIRPQKIPCEVEYPDIVIGHSAPSREFDVDIRSALNKHGKCSLNNGQTRVKVWYIDKFSMLCSLCNLRKIGTESLHIFTDKYTKEGLNKIN